MEDVIEAVISRSLASDEATGSKRTSAPCAGPSHGAAESGTPSASSSFRCDMCGDVKFGSAVELQNHRRRHVPGPVLSRALFADFNRKYADGKGKGGAIAEDLLSLVSKSLDDGTYRCKHCNPPYTIHADDEHACELQRHHETLHPRSAPSLHEIFGGRVAAPTS